MKKRLLRFAGYAIMLAAFVYLIHAVIGMHPDFSKIRPTPATAVWSLVTVAGVAAVAYFSAIAWKAVLEFIQGTKIRYGAVLSVYAKANIGKYLPGNVMHFVARNLFAGRLGFSQLDVAFCSVVEVAMLVLTACLWSATLALHAFAALLARSASALATRFVLAAVLAAVVVALVAAFVVLIHRNRLFYKFRRFFTRAFLRLAVKLFAFYSVTLLLPGVFMLRILSVAFGCGFTAASVGLVLAAYTVSWVAGYIVPGVPGGLGIRETMIMLVLSPIYPSDVVFMAVIFHRILSIAGDAAAFAVVPLASKFWPERR